MRRWLFVFLLGLSSIQSSPVQAADLAPLLDSIQTDPSSKVRLQGLLILGRRLELEEGPSPPGVLEVVRARALNDDTGVVRAVAGRVLGQHGSTRDVLLLEKMTQDSDQVVAQAAAKALERLRARLGPSAPMVVWEVDRFALQDGYDLSSALQAKVRRHLREHGEGLRLLPPAEADGSGHWFRISAQPLAVEPAGDQVSVTVTLKVALGNWPERNLRHVLTTRARMRVTSVENDRPRLARRLLEAAVAQAVTAALKDIRGG
ncbi:MAG: HEAT repeat domain-containing protein [Myxococcota bacterium]